MNALMATAAALTANLEEPAPTRVKTLVSIDDSFIAGCHSGYQTDKWCKKLISASKGMPELTVKDGLWFIGECLIVPAHGGLHEEILRLAHNALGHFGFYNNPNPGMRKNLEEGYIPSCCDCMQNKSFTMKPTGPLHPLPVPDERCSSVSLDFIGPLPINDRFDCILTITDRLGSELQIIPTNTTLTAKECAVIFFSNWYCENGLPDDIISDRDKLFVSKFWAHLIILTDIKHKLSLNYHPQSNGASERTNGTVNQCIHFHVSRNQKGWVQALPVIQFQIMKTVNKSTGYTPFQLRFGWMPQILPPIINPPAKTSSEYISACEIIDNLRNDVADTRDNLMLAKITQSHHPNER